MPAALASCCSILKIISLLAVRLGQPLAINRNVSHSELVLKGQSMVRQNSGMGITCFLSGIFD